MDNGNNDNKPMMLEDLAGMVQREFGALRQEMATKEDLKAFATKEEMALGFRSVNERLDLMHHDTADLPAIRDELDSLRERVARLEATLKIAA